MGSTGANTFGDYTSTGATKCDESIDAVLEDVARLDFYKGSKRVPPKGTPVRLRPKAQANRLVVEDTAGGTAIGNLPTRLNYLLLCMTKDYVYEGTVTASAGGKMPMVEVHLDPV